MRDRRRDSVVVIVVRYIGSAGMVYALAVALCAVLGLSVPEALTALASGSVGYLAGVLTPRPEHGTQAVTIEQPADKPVPTTETNSSSAEQAS